MIKVFECCCFSCIIEFVVRFVDCVATTYNTSNITQSAVKSVMMDHDSLVKWTFECRSSLKKLRKKKAASSLHVFGEVASRAGSKLNQEDIDHTKELKDPEAEDAITQDTAVSVT